MLHRIKDKQASRPLAGAIGRLRILLADNGLRWSAYYSMLAVLRWAGSRIYGRMIRLEERRGLTGVNSIRSNYDAWQRWDWSRKGEEWTSSEAWKQSLIDDVMLKVLTPGTTILEIGPGAGRWTVALQKLARRLILVDLSDRCIELCRERFAGAQNIEYHVNDGRTLSAIEPASVDGVWSFDVFVHVAPPDIDSYLGEISRVLRDGGRGVVHHAKQGRGEYVAFRRMRSSMTATLFAEMLQRHGLTLIRQFDAWGLDDQFSVRPAGDVISVFQK